VTADLLTYVAIGFIAQLVDGTIGMAYGVVSTTALLNAGLSPLTATANIHFAELFIGGLSGAFHAARGQVAWPLVRRLVVTGAHWVSWEDSSIRQAVAGAHRHVEPDSGRCLAPYGGWLVNCRRVRRNRRACGSVCRPWRTTAGRVDGGASRGGVIAAQSPRAWPLSFPRAS
jgi:hypothetical protein